MFVCMRSESQSASHSSPPQLKGVRVISACVCARVCVCWYYFAHLSPVSVCLPVHTVTKKQHTNTTNTNNTDKYTILPKPAGAHRDTKTTHIHTQPTLNTQANACPVMIENQHVHSSTVSQYSATRNTHTHESDESPAKTPGGRADNWL
jgi:hypothetical protein